MLKPLTPQGPRVHLLSKLLAPRGHNGQDPTGDETPISKNVQFVGSRVDQGHRLCKEVAFSGELARDDSISSLEG